MRAAADRPLVLMAHQDVVPVDGSAPWQHPAFGAEIHDGAIWGRGTLDDKGALTAICEAVETLLARDFVPAQDVWLSFGAREEVSGPDARLAVAMLEQFGVRPWLVLDEGGAVAHQAFPGIDPPLGVIGVSEKGTTTVELVADGVRATLRSVVPPLTPPAWTSVMTGKRPGEHGVFDFFQKETPDSRYFRFTTSHDVRSATTWSLAGEYGLRSNVLNFPLMFPAPPIFDGCLVPGGWMPWRQLRLGCRPAGLFDRL